MTTSPQQTRVYLSGPMFSDGDKKEQCDLAEALEAPAAGFKCHVPHRDGMEVAAVMELLDDPDNHIEKMLEPLVVERCVVWVTRAVVALDVFQVIEGCPVTVLNIDGRVPDEGSLVEATLAWYAGHTVVPYKTTSISELDGNNNPMIGVISGWARVCKTPTDVVAAVKKAVKSGAAAGQSVTTPPLDVQQLIDLGKVISNIRTRRSLNQTQLSAALNTLANLPPKLMKLLEPVPLLQPICQQLVLGAIEYSKLGAERYRRRRLALFQDEIAKLHDAVDEPGSGVREAIADNPIIA